MNGPEALAQTMTSGHAVNMNSMTRVEKLAPSPSGSITSSPAPTLTTTVTAVAINKPAEELRRGLTAPLHFHCCLSPRAGSGTGRTNNLRTPAG
ncbi:hypothetical protein GCM10009760_12490 [Kitasatospora kazusensis]|uniref:FXSXX-COOH protein n=1 Tax=Kitasatospora kazusensis TaxID=407974 RepID=A0ABP5KRW8_9ACTN